MRRKAGLSRRGLLAGLAAAAVAQPAAAAIVNRTRVQSIQVGTTLPATALQQIQANIDTNSYCEIGYSSAPQQLVGQIKLGTRQKLIISREATLQWLSALGDQPGVINKTIAPASLSAYDEAPSVVGGGTLLGPWNGVAASTQNQAAIYFIACRDPVFDVRVDGWQGDGVLLSYKAGSPLFYTYGAQGTVRARNVLRNGCSITAGEGFDVTVLVDVDPVTGRGCGLHGFDAEPDSASCLIRDGRFKVWANGGGGGPLGGQSYCAAVSDKNGGLARNIVGSVIARGGAYGGLYYRGVLGLTCDVEVEDLGSHGIVGGNGASRASRVTLRGDIGVKSGTSNNGWIDGSEGTVAEVLAMKVRQPNNVNPIVVKSAAGGWWGGIDLTMTGGGNACAFLDACSELEIVAPRFSGGTYALDFRNSLGACTHNKVRGGSYLGQTAGAVIEAAGCDYNKVYDPDLEGSFTSFTWSGAHSGTYARP